MAQREIIILRQAMRWSPSDRQGDAGDPRARRRHVETMYAAPGIGLAAIQVAQAGAADHHGSRQTRENGETERKPPSSSIRNSRQSEDCRSTRRAACRSEYYEESSVRRGSARWRFTHLDGKVHEEDAEGLYATCIQHEIDHLNGVLFNRLSLQAEARPRARRNSPRSPSARRSRPPPLSRHARACRGHSTSFLWARKTWMAGQARP